MIFDLSFTRANASHLRRGAALISISFRVDSCPPDDPGLHTDAECQSAGCGRFDANRWRSDSGRPKNGSYELAVVALSTHSGGVQNDRSSLSCLSKIAHREIMVWWPGER